MQRRRQISLAASDPIPSSMAIAPSLARWKALVRACLDSLPNLSDTRLREGRDESPATALCCA